MCQARAIERLAPGTEKINVSPTLSLMVFPASPGPMVTVREGPPGPAVLVPVDCPAWTSGLELLPPPWVPAA
jgi:hypothetical protein